MLPDTETAAPEAVEQAPAPITPVEEQAPAPDELNALKRQLAEAQRQTKRLETEQRKAAEAKAAEQGEWQKLAEEKSVELERERTERARVEREQRITRLASRMKFIDPQDAVYRVQGEDGDTDEAALAALERIAEQSGHLIRKDPPARPEIGQVLEPSATAPQTGRPQPPHGKAPLQSLDEANALSVKEAVERMPEIEWLERNQQ